METRTFWHFLTFEDYEYRCRDVPAIKRFCLHRHIPLFFIFMKGVLGSSAVHSPSCCWLNLYQNKEEVVNAWPVCLCGALFVECLSHRSSWTVYKGIHKNIFIIKCICKDFTECLFIYVTVVQKLFIIVSLNIPGFFVTWKVGWIYIAWLVLKWTSHFPDININTLYIDMSVCHFRQWTPKCSVLKWIK